MAREAISREDLLLRGQGVWRRAAAEAPRRTEDKTKEELAEGLRTPKEW